MISPDVEMLDMDPLQWRHLYDLVVGQPPRQLIIVHENGRVLKAFHSEHGLQPRLKTLDVVDPLALAGELHRSEKVDQVWILERAAIDDYYSVLHTSYDPQEDGDRYFQRVRLALDNHPGLVCYPPREHGMHLMGIAYAAMERFVARVPDANTLVLGVFDECSIWASLILRVAQGQIRLITTSDAILPVDVPVADWRAMAGRMLDRVTAKIGVPFAGLFCTHEAFLDLVKNEDKPARIAIWESKGELILHFSTVNGGTDEND